MIEGKKKNEIHQFDIVKFEEYRKKTPKVGFLQLQMREVHHVGVSNQDQNSQQNQEASGMVGEKKMSSILLDQLQAEKYL